MSTSSSCNRRTFLTVLAVTVVSPRMGTDGWPFASVDQFPGADVDPVYQSQHVKDLYLRADPNFKGRFTVPVLWDKKQNTIVNNESSEIIRIFNSEFNSLLPEGKAKLDFYPEELRKEIDKVNEWVYDQINSTLHFHCAVCVRNQPPADGVYKSGFATSSQAYRIAVFPLFEALDRIEGMLKDKTYLIGDRLTEADIRLFVTIVSTHQPSVHTCAERANRFGVRYDSTRFMSATSSATFGPFATVILTSICKLLLLVPSPSLLTDSLEFPAGCVGCIGRMTLFSPPPTLNT